MTELSRLLAFMDDADRDAAIAMYDNIFDEAADEEALMKQLVSPTRQAVIVARAYNARDRKGAPGENVQQPAAANGEPQELPDYAKAVCRVRDEVLEKQQELAQQMQEEEPVLPAEPLPEETETPVEEPENTPEEIPAEAELTDGEESEESEESAQSEPAEGTAEPESAEETSEPEPAEDTPSDEAEPTEEASDDSTAEAVEEAPAEEDDKVEKIIDNALAETEPAAVPAQEPVPEDAEMIRKPRIFLMILYIIAAIPVAIVGIAVMLIPALVFLALAALCIGLGVFVVSCAFGSMRILADIMIVLGTALILFALGLLFLWTFVWFIGGAIAGFIRGIIHLGGKWCFKEVAAA